MKSNHTNHDASPDMMKLLEVITDAQSRFAALLSSYLDEHETTLDQYVRYLSFQYHLTKGVQRYFFAIGSHPDLARRRRLRDFVVNFANEEELHYLVAAKDLEEIGCEPLPLPFDVELWHAYFHSIVNERPFIRLGAATVLENISDGPARTWVKRALSGPFLNPANTKFLVLHQHEVLPHGDQVLNAISKAQLEARHFRDLLEGARKGAVLYLRMAEWAIHPIGLASLCDGTGASTSAEESQRINDFDMSELEAYNVQ